MRALAIVLLLGGPALAQPMFDPQMLAKMSGIPRPDPQVPPLTITVRVCRGDFSHPLIGQEVTLTEDEGEPRTEKTDQASRATFGGLEAGKSYHASATAFGATLTSQEIQLPETPGIRLMLVFPEDVKALLGRADGVARKDERLAAGTLEVRVLDEDDKPLAGLEVTLAHGQKGGAAANEQQAKTDADGRARWDGLAVSADDGFVATVARDGFVSRSQPFTLQSDHGSLLGLRALRATRDTKALAFDKRSHLILEVKDDAVEVVENLVLENSATSPFDPGTDGFRVPLPKGAEGAQTLPNGPHELTIETGSGGGVAVWHGGLPPGTSQLSFAFMLPVKNGAVTIEQVVPATLDPLQLVTDRFDGMDVVGEGLTKEEREMGGRQFWVVRGPVIQAGKPFSLTLTGLPSRSVLGRDLVLAIALALLVWGVAAGWNARGGLPSRAKLERHRDRLLDELATMAPHERAREPIVGQLEKIYRELDQ